MDVFFFFFFQETEEHRTHRKEFQAAFKQANRAIAALGLKGVSYSKLWAISFSAYAGMSAPQRASELGVPQRRLYKAMDVSELDGHTARVKAVIRVTLSEALPDAGSLYQAVKAASAQSCLHP